MATIALQMGWVHLEIDRLAISPRNGVSSICTVLTLEYRFLALFSQALYFTDFVIADLALVVCWMDFLILE